MVGRAPVLHNRPDPRRHRGLNASLIEVANRRIGQMRRRDAFENRVVEHVNDGDSDSLEIKRAHAATDGASVAVRPRNEDNDATLGERLPGSTSRLLVSMDGSPRCWLESPSTPTNSRRTGGSTPGQGSRLRRGPTGVLVGRDQRRERVRRARVHDVWRGVVPENRETTQPERSESY